MVRTMSVQQASGQLGTLVRALHPGDQIVLTDGEKCVARIVPEEIARPNRMAGLCKGMLDIVHDDDDGMLEHFKDYVP